jgi:fimbrial isopeptide formation D2 family protein/LPXTG-motif cell wall-anchored protein
MIPGLWRAMHETIPRYLKKKNEKGNEEREREETSMKKFKKLLAGLLAGAMMLGSMSATAFAAEETNTPKMTAATIDTSLKGSLTIHKYEYNGNSGKTGTGETSDESNVPSDAKPLEGAGFTIYKVADVKELTSYYSTNPTTLPSVNDYVETGKIKQKYENTKVKEKITKADGTATFTNLELGFYVVIETTTPDKVTTPAAPFLVSIPMTTAKGDNWLYDVHVYPKNKTTYGGVTLVKQGKDDALLKGVTFVLQKQNGDTWTNVTTNESTGARLNLVTDTDGKITVDGLSQGTYRFIETDRGGNDGYIMDGATAYQFTVNADGTIKYGTNEPAANITLPVTNEKPDMTKQVKDRTKEPETWKQETDYNVGDMVPYKITVDVPSNITKLKEFTLTDTPKNLDDKVDTVKVTCNDADVAAEAYSVAKDGEHGFKITFVTKEMAAYAEQQLVITYNAELLSSAVTTTDGNTNSAKLEYSNKILPGQDDPDNPNKPENPDTKPGKDYIENTTTVYTFGLQVVKKAEKAEGAPLEGVQFDLYKEVPAGTDNAIPDDAAKALGLDSNKTWLKINEAPLTTDENGKVSQSGLANGTYYLVETKTKTNEGYNLLKAPVKVELNIDYVTTTKDEYYKDEKGVKTLVKHEVDTTTFTENNSSSNGTHTETIINKKGFTLPTTGGMGTIAITALGVALAFAGVLIIGASRKKTVK